MKQALDSKAKWQQEAERLSHQIAQQRKTVEQWKGASSSHSSGFKECPVSLRRTSIASGIERLVP